MSWNLIRPQIVTSRRWAAAQKERPQEITLGRWRAMQKQLAQDRGIGDFSRDAMRDEDLVFVAYEMKHH